MTNSGSSCLKSGLGWNSKSWFKYIISTLPRITDITMILCGNQMWYVPFIFETCGTRFRCCRIWPIHFGHFSLSFGQSPSSMFLTNGAQRGVTLNINIEHILLQLSTLPDIDASVSQIWSWLDSTRILVYGLNFWRHPFSQEASAPKPHSYSWSEFWILGWNGTSPSLSSTSNV